MFGTYATSNRIRVALLTVSVARAVYASRSSSLQSSDWRQVSSSSVL